MSAMRDLPISFQHSHSLLFENTQLYPFPLAIILSFNGNEQSRGGNAICRDVVQKWPPRAVLARSAQRARGSRLIQVHRIASGEKENNA